MGEGVCQKIEHCRGVMKKKYEGASQLRIVIRAIPKKNMKVGSQRELPFRAILFVIPASDLNKTPRKVDQMSVQNGQNGYP